MRLHIGNDVQVQCLAFTVAYTAVIGASDDPWSTKTQALALSAGCGAVLALKRAPGQPHPRPTDPEPPSGATP